MRFSCTIQASLQRHGDPPAGAPLGSVGPVLCNTSVVVLGAGRSEEEAIREASKAFEVQAAKLSISDEMVMRQQEKAEQAQTDMLRAQIQEVPQREQ